MVIGRTLYGSLLKRPAAVQGAMAPGCPTTSRGGDAVVDLSAQIFANWACALATAVREKGTDGQPLCAGINGLDLRVAVRTETAAAARASPVFAYRQ